MLDTMPISHELTFLTQHTGQDELTLLSHALHFGLNALYRQAIEQAFIDDKLPREEAMAVLGRAQVEQIEYAKQAFAQEIVRGLSL